ncbi:hypothetical protein HHK36_008488 [Tetracentron sinense]|uniref:HVA22-like protein n=1 Tax=Tetracentron sinense TaxID=13715 RepID=A0A834ZMK9_TETSI|nr:hypothetical protein HHK36_008488 [Tetracentron sinense]
MALLGSTISSEVGLRLLLCPFGSNVVIRTACLWIFQPRRSVRRQNSLLVKFSTPFWFPLYYHMKFAFLVWLQLPSADGAKHLYMNHLRPFLLRHQARLDQVLGFVYGEMVRPLIILLKHIITDMLRFNGDSARCTILVTKMHRESEPPSGRRPTRDPLFGEWHAVDVLIDIHPETPIIVKFISAHQAEIQFAKGMLVKILGSANQMLSDIIHPVKPRGQIEGPTKRIQDSESDHED